MKMMYVKQLQIHNSGSTWSSKDRVLYKELTMEEFEKLVKDFPNCETKISEEFKFSVIFVEDNFFSNLPFGKDATKEQMQERVDYWKSVASYTESLEEFSKRKEDCYKAEEKIRCENRKKEGYIFYTSPDWEYNQKEAQGGFSSVLWNYKPVTEYTKNFCFGYFGHSVRRVELDKYFEECIKFVCQFAKVDVDWREIAYNYLSSSLARHFSDNLECLDFKQQKEKIFNNIKSIWNQAYLYSLEEHEGTLKSTQELMKKYKENLFNEVIK